MIRHRSALTHRAASLAAISATVLGLLVVPVVTATAATPPGQDTDTVGLFVPVTPSRVVAGRLLAAGTAATVQVLGVGGVRSSAVAGVAMTLTASGATAAGGLTVYASQRALPGTTSLDLPAAATVSNLVVSRVGNDGAVLIANRSAGPVRVTADLVGYTTGGFGQPVTGSLLMAPDPGRVLDTRTGVGAVKGRVTGNRTLTVQVSGTAPLQGAGVPDAVLVNLRALSPTATGSVRCFADGTQRPAVTSVDVTAGRSTSTLALVPLARNGRIACYVSSSGALDLAADVFGYVDNGNPTRQGTVVPVAPTRVMDTRSGLGVPKAALGAGRSVRLVLDGKGGMPAGAGTASVLTLRAFGAKADGALRVRAAGSPLAAVSSLQFRAGAAVTSGTAVSSLGAGGSVEVYNASSQPVDVVVDTQAYVLGSPRVPLAFADHRTVMQQQGRLSSVSCTSSSFCVAGDHFGNVTVYAGDRWSSPQRLFAYGVEVSCTSPTSCVAVSSDQLSLVSFRVYNGSGWSDPAVVPAADGAEAVSCVTASFCVFPDSDGNILTWDGTTWRVTAELQAPEHGAGQLVSCSSTTSCTVVLASSYVSRFDGTSWTTPQAPAGDPTLRSLSCPTSTFCAAGDIAGDVSLARDGQWSPPAHVAGRGELSALACTSATFCVAGDGYGGASVFDGSAWTPSRQVLPEFVTALSCPEFGFCVAVDDAQSGVGYVFGAWTSPIDIDHQQGQLRDVDCADTQFCGAVDSFGNTVVFGSSADGQVRQAQPGLQLRSVSCPARRCVAVGDDGGNSYAVRFDATTASPAVLIARDATVTDVSCTPTLCVAVDTAGRVRTSADGARWSAPTLIDSVAGLSSVSCTGANYCLAADYSGGVVQLVAGVWSARKGPTAGPAIEAVHCEAAGRCSASDPEGFVLRYVDGLAQDTHRNIDYPGYPPTFSACSGDTCLALTHGGDRFWFRDPSTWVRGQAPSLGFTVGLSCPTSMFCATVTDDGQAAFARPTS